MRLPTRLQRLGVVLLAAGSLSFPAAAQQYGNLHGTVSDEEGAALPGVSMTLTGMGAPQVTTTGARGDYRFLNLDPGIYSLTASLDGFSTLEQPRVVVALNRNAILDFTLSGAVQELMTVTAETPLLDERQISQGTVLSQVELETIPTPRDPWAIAIQAPGVLSSGTNVGGSDAGAVVNHLGLGTRYWDNDWMLDGIQITDTVAIGFSPTFFDFEQFESIEVATGGPDVTKNTGGVSINMVTRRGSNEFRGTARFLSVKDDGLGFLGNSSSSFDCADLHPDQDCDTFTPNRIEQIAEYGFEAGGAAIRDRLWFWGSYGVQDIDLVASNGNPEAKAIENVSVKLNGQLTAANSAVASWNNGEFSTIRGGSPFRAPETLIDDSGPKAFWRFEDTHVFGSSLFLSGSYQKSDVGYSHTPLSDCHDLSCPMDQETLVDSDGVWKNNFFTGYVRRPEEAIRIDGSYFFNSGDVSHQLKFGGRVRESTGISNFLLPGRNILHIAGENFGNSPGPVDFFMLYRGRGDLGPEVEYNSLWVQDTLAAGRWTVNLGARWDLQDGVNPPGTTGPSAVPQWLPPITFDDPVKPPFDWETVTPRIGITYAVGEARETLLRTSFSQFPSALSTWEVGWTNPGWGWNGYGAYAYFYFLDIEEEDNQWNGTEPYGFLFGFGYDPQNPTSNLSTMSDSFDPELTTELIVGVEHALRPDLVVGADYTWRRIDDVQGFRNNVRPRGDTSVGRPGVAADYLFDRTVGEELPDGSPADVDLFALDPGLEYTGFIHYENDARSREYGGLALTLQKRLANRWALRGYVHWGETTWNVPQSFLEASDPNPDWSGDDQDGAIYLVHSSGAQRGGRYLQSGWQANLNGLVQIAPDRPWAFTLAGNVFAREGHPLPYRYRGFGADGILHDVSLLDGEMDRFRLDDLVTADLRAEKEMGVSEDVSLTLGLDLFNALNVATPLSRTTGLNTPVGGYLNAVVAPRVWRLSVRVRWR